MVEVRRNEQNTSTFDRVRVETEEGREKVDGVRKDGLTGAWVDHEWVYVTSYL